MLILHQLGLWTSSWCTEAWRAYFDDLRESQKEQRTRQMMWLDSFPMPGSNWRCCFCLRAAVHQETVTPVVQFISSVNQGLTSLNCCSGKNAIKDIICLHRFSAIQVTEGVRAEGKWTFLEDMSSGLALRFVNSGLVGWWGSPWHKWP